MDTLSDTTWDVIINGTGLAQSLLALALSRSGKKVLHIDSNRYYGGPDAAFSLDEAQEWAEEVNKDSTESCFRDASIFVPDSSASEASEGTTAAPQLASNRSYTLSLSPYFLHARSQLMSALVSSKVFRQLEFMAVGSWWIYTPEQASSENSALGAEKIFSRVPGNREDVFAATHISMKSKRTLMRLLRHVTQPKEEVDGDEDMSMPLKEYLTSKFSVPEELHDPLLSLSLSQLSHQDTPASYAVPRIQRHIASIGHLGPGFGAVIAKYGGGAEILQAACRASAVGGGVYALDTPIHDLLWRTTPEFSEHPFLAMLGKTGTVQAKFIFCPASHDLSEQASGPAVDVSRSINIVSATFPSLFPVTVEGAPVPATAVLMFPGDTLGSPQSPPVYVQVHSSDTGECPRHQSIIYCSVALPGPEGQSLLASAVDRLVQAEGSSASVLWSLRYTHRGNLSNGETRHLTTEDDISNLYKFPVSSLDLAFEDDALELAKEAWKKVVGDEVDDDDFMKFDDRDGASDDS
ncbi:uncharacterized protein N7515_002334 [Penicillium bovifimosum]|uniref:Rab proteins geranylgeranyltransferase n=1 Tax=Penicillium bovifimosum TaxID=126998 RepID=A0A9W9HBD6_9EURO|nr:uncharacterized protein N7515_002334 [Penicillium bovifimosum]KAJ5143547.1 hypothetical protein N7515_002334 [Penicillium bovifimosum]